MNHSTSDRIPVLIKLVYGTKSDKHSLFRFNNSWISYNKYNNVILFAWKNEALGNPLFIFLNKLKIFKRSFKGIE